MPDMKYREEIENSIRIVFSRLFEDKNKMDFVLSQGGFEKYFQFEVAAELSLSGSFVHVEGKHRSDVLFYDLDAPSAVIEMGAGFQSQPNHTKKPLNDYKSFEGLKGSCSDFSNAKFYSLMMLAEKIKGRELPKGCKQSGHLSKNAKDHIKEWEASDFEVLLSESYDGERLSLSVTLLSK
tara:strand:- start:2534 stop:3073 length:540 start_codon:yes stop_codon:yes gene_type:complete